MNSKMYDILKSVQVELHIEFEKLVGEEIHNVGCSKTIEECIREKVEEYVDSGNKYNLVKGAATVMSVCIDDCAMGAEKFKMVSWSSMPEFSNYPIIQRVNIFLDVWTRTENPIFLTELFTVLMEEYSK